MITFNTSATIMMGMCMWICQMCMTLCAFISDMFPISKKKHGTAQTDTRKVIVFNRETLSESTGFYYAKNCVSNEQNNKKSTFKNMSYANICWRRRLFRLYEAGVKNECSI